MLEYDNSAFYYFMISLLALYLVPGTYYSIKYVYRAYNPEKSRQEINRSELEKSKNKKLKVFDTGFKKLANPGFICNVIGLIVAAILFVFLVYQVSSDSELARFDPYKILEIDRDATDRQIKRAYKLKALEFHPDKNLGDKRAENMFMMVAKAYEALTDEVAKENWKQYGNPDGKQSLEVSIGLPTFLLDENNHNLILIVYLIGLVVIIPSLVGLWYRYSRQYGENNVMYETYQYFDKFTHLNSDLKFLPEAFALAREFQKINKLTSNEDYKTLKTLVEALLDKSKFGKDGPFMQVPKNKTETTLHVLKGNAMLHCHLGRAQMKEAGIEMPAEWQANLDIMLSQSQALINALVDIALSHRDLKQVQASMFLAQCVTQGVWPYGSVKSTTAAAYLQLPHVNLKDVKMLTKLPFDQFLRLDSDERRKKVPSLQSCSDQQLAEFDRVCGIMPVMDVNVRAFVDGEEEIAQRDLVTVEVVLTRTNVAEGQRAEPVHAPYIPVVKEEGWWVLLVTTRGQVINIERVTSQEREVKIEMKFPAPDQPGKHQLEVIVASNSYLGLDHTKEVKFNVIPIQELPAFEPHKEDLELDNEVSLFEGALMSNVDSDVSSDEEEEDRRRAPVAQKTAPQKQPTMTDAQLRRRKKRIDKKKSPESAEAQSTSDEEDDP